MTSNMAGLAADTKIETPEGAMTIRAAAGKAIAVFTREADGHVRFRLMRNVRKTLEQQPVVKVTLENGRAFRVAAEQILFRRGMEECAAGELRPGDDLESVFHFPAGYRFSDDHDGSMRESGHSLRVTAVEPGGSADLYALEVNQGRCFMLTAGVLCKADVPST